MLVLQIISYSLLIKIPNLLIVAIQNLKYELRLLTALFGLKNIAEADEVKYYLDTDLYNFTRQIYN